MEENHYATDGRCHNSNWDSLSHECHKPAAWLGTNPAGFTMGYCDRCRREGYEARQVVKWDCIGVAMAD